MPNPSQPIAAPASHPAPQGTAAVGGFFDSTPMTVSESTVREIVRRLKGELARATLLESLSVAIDDPDLDDPSQQTVAGIVADSIGYLESDLIGFSDPALKRESRSAIEQLRKLLQRLPCSRPKGSGSESGRTNSFTRSTLSRPWPSHGLLHWGICGVALSPAKTPTATGAPEALPGANTHHASAMASAISTASSSDDGLRP